MARPRKVKEVTPAVETKEPAAPAPNPSADLAQALLEAIRQSNSNAGQFVKKTVFNKSHGGPWASDPKNPKPRLKRRAYHHNMLIGDPTEPSNRLTAEEIILLNQLKPGVFCNGFVRVIRRRDKGIDIDYPVRTNAQKIKLSSEFGIRSFAELLKHCIDEASSPKPVVNEDDDA